MAQADKAFDLVLQGATGFTGRLAAAEIARHAPDGLRWAVAGRDPEKAAALAAEHGVPGIVAEGLDKAAVERLAASTRVVLSCAGPFSRYGTLLVQACAEHQTHYADLTGEVPWIQNVLAPLHSKCVANGTALVPCSGFDSVPTDLGVHDLLAALTAMGVGLNGLPITGFYTLRGGLNGGTLHSGLALAEDGALGGFTAPPATEPSAATNATGSATAGLSMPEAKAPQRPNVFHVDCLDRWAAPFLMAPVNEWIVARSFASQFGRTGPTYREHMAVKRRLQAHVMSGLLGLSNAMLGSKIGRDLLRRFGPQPGEGPTERKIQAGFARLTLIAGELDSPHLIKRWNWKGDPSNLITVRCLVQTGLALAAGEAQASGLLTPARAFGSRLLERLVAIDATHPETLQPIDAH